MTQANVATGFVAGFISFISPCVLPLVPAYISYLTGSTLEDLKDGAAQRGLRAKAIKHAIAFILGFTTIFVLLGLSASAIGSVLGAHRDAIAKIGGMIIIILGLQMIGILKIPWLMMDKRAHVRTNRTYAASFVVGIGFAAGWSPCIGPILSGILLLAAQEKHTAEAAIDLLAYSAGLAVPFLIVAAALGWALNAMKRIKPILPKLEFAAGLIMIVAGIIVASNSFLRLSGALYQFVPVPKM